MSLSEIITTLLIVNIIPSYFISRDARKRDMNGVGWFLIVLLFSFIGMILYFIIRNPLTIDFNNVYNSNYKKCPECAEYIREEAKVCRFCGYRYIMEEKAVSEAIEITEVKFPLELKIIEDNAPLYSEAHNKSKVLKHFQKGESLIAVSQSGEFNEWVKVEVQNEVGYILRYDVNL